MPYKNISLGILSLILHLMRHSYNAQVGSAIDRNISPDDHFCSAKVDSFVYKCRIISRTMFFQDENLPSTLFDSSVKIMLFH